MTAGMITTPPLTPDSPEFAALEARRQALVRKMAEATAPLPREELKELVELHARLRAANSTSRPPTKPKKFTDDDL